METTKYKTYKDYYQDEEFRKRQKKYLAEKIICECGTSCCRSYIAAHRKTKAHNKKLENIDKVKLLEESKTKIEERKAKIEAHILKLQNDVDKIDRKIIKINN